MNTVGVRLVGGLGNQMFQYAAARALALRTEAELDLDLSWFGTVPEREFALLPFAINASRNNKLNYQATKTDLLSRVKRRLGFSQNVADFPVFSETSFRYDPRIEQVNAPVFLDGYFQSEQYFTSFQETIRDEFVVQTPPSSAAAQLLDQISATNSICAHIRRGDYVNNPDANAYHGACSLDYYREGLTFVTQGLPQPHCFVFSDDPKWVHENFNPSVPMTIVDIHGVDEAHEDLRLMAACQHYVIANSSFSWWGAWLGSHRDKQIVAPLRWFQNSDNDTSDLIPKTWKRI